MHKNVDYVLRLTHKHEKIDTIRCESLFEGHTSSKVECACHLIAIHELALRHIYDEEKIIGSSFSPFFFFPSPF
jgi:hypothetical protein